MILVLVISYHLYNSSVSVDISISGGRLYLISSCSHEVIYHTFLNPNFKYIVQNFFFLWLNNL